MISKLLEIVIKPYIDNSLRVDLEQTLRLMEIRSSSTATDDDFIKELGLILAEKDNDEAFKQIWAGFGEALAKGKDKKIITAAKCHNDDQTAVPLFKLPIDVLERILVLVERNGLGMFAGTSQRNRSAASTIVTRFSNRLQCNPSLIKRLILIPTSRALQFYDEKGYVGAVPCKFKYKEIKVRVQPLILDDNTFMVVFKTHFHEWEDSIVVYNINAPQQPNQFPHQKGEKIVNIARLLNGAIMIHVCVSSTGFNNEFYTKDEIRIIDEKDGKLINKIGDLGKGVSATAVMSNGNIAIGIEKRVRGVMYSLKIYNSEGRLLLESPYDYKITDIVERRDGKIVVAKCEIGLPSASYLAGIMRVFNPQNGSAGEKIVFSADFLVLLPHDHIALYNPDASKIRVFDLNLNRNVLNTPIREASIPRTTFTIKPIDLYLACVQTWPDLYGEQHIQQADNSNSNSNFNAVSVRR